MSRSAWNFEYSKPSSDAAASRATSPIAPTHEVVVPPCHDVKLGCMLAGRRACHAAPSRNLILRRRTSEDHKAGPDPRRGPDAKKYRATKCRSAHARDAAHHSDGQAVHGHQCVW